MSETPLYKISDAFVRLRGIVPGGFDGLVGVYTQDIFKPKAVVFHRCAGLYAFVAGARVNFDDAEHEVENSYSLSVGAFIAFHVKNENELPRGIEIDVFGRAPTPGEVGQGCMTGFLTTPEPDQGAA